MGSKLSGAWAKFFQTRPKVRHVSVRISAAAALVCLAACSEPSPSLDPSFYEDPSSGKEVPLRPSHPAGNVLEEPKSSAPSAAPETEMGNPRIQINFTTRQVRFTVQRTDSGRSEDLVLSGPLNEDLSALLEDTQKVSGKSRAKAFAQCLPEHQGRPCPEMFVDLYWNEGGKTRKKQFLADPYPAPSPYWPIPKKLAPPPGKNTSAQVHPGSDKEKKPNDMVTAVKQTPTPRPKTPPAALIDANQNEEVQPLSTEGYFVSPAPPPQFFEDLEGPAEPKATPLATQSPKPKTQLSVAPPPFGLDLVGGGRSLGRPYTYTAANGARIRGAIQNRGTLLPLESKGLARVSAEHKAYGSGYLVSFLKMAATSFQTKYPNCGELVARNLSQPGGGELRFEVCPTGSSRRACAHKSHQNGLDVDLAYLPMGDTRSVLHKTQVSPDFKTECNWALLKHLNSITLPDGSPAPYVFFVHAKIKQHFCEWTRRTKMNSAQDAAVHAALVPTRSGHDDHIHLRLRCSPQHPGCRQDGPPRPELTECGPSAAQAI